MVFYEVGGFQGIDDLASGDDELLLQKVAAIYPNQIGFLKNRDAIVYTDAKPNLKEFMQQRRRWASKSVKYKDKFVVAVVVGIWLFNLSLLVNGVLSFFDVAFFKLLLLQFALKYVFEIVFLIPIMSFFKRPYLVWLLSIISPIHVIYFVYVGIMGNAKRYDWKGRNVK
jgi:cellulose synthase/poly-beta-1,6-N-acetylglucosamine synthase-like glycosyltransferase